LSFSLRLVAAVGPLWVRKPDDRREPQQLQASHGQTR
jgi:hypothetical protein